jgi:hypothetical protein
MGGDILREKVNRLRPQNFLQYFGRTQTQPILNMPKHLGQSISHTGVLFSLMFFFSVAGCRWLAKETPSYYVPFFLGAELLSLTGFAVMTTRFTIFVASEVWTINLAPLMGTEHRAPVMDDNLQSLWMTDISCNVWLNELRVKLTRTINSGSDIIA